jgi:hypothetical protein
MGLFFFFIVIPMSSIALTVCRLGNVFANLEWGEIVILLSAWCQVMPVIECCIRE